MEIFPGKSFIFPGKIGLVLLPHVVLVALWYTLLVFTLESVYKWLQANKMLSGNWLSLVPLTKTPAADL